MKLYHLIFFIIFSVNSFAQEASSIPSTGIPRVNMTIPSTSNATPHYSISKPFEITKFRKPSKIYDAPQLEKPNKFNSPTSDLNPGKMMADKLNKISRNKNNESSTMAKRENIFFGEIRTKDDFLTVRYRDFGIVDNDMIKIWLNDKFIVYEVVLSSDFQEISLPLNKGINKLEFEAITQGYMGGNTAEFKILNIKGEIIFSNYWDNMATGFRASIIILKE